jgi:hypothetical protein
VPVVMVATDQLQRIPGAGPGTVRHRGGEVLWAEPQRAASLLRELADRADRPRASEATPEQAPARPSLGQANPAPITTLQTGSVQTGSVQAGSINTASVQAGSINTASVHTASVQTTSGQPASAETTPAAATPAGDAAEQADAARAPVPPNAVRLPSLGPAPKP